MNVLLIFIFLKVKSALYDNLYYSSFEIFSRTTEPILNKLNWHKVSLDEGNVFTVIVDNEIIFDMSLYIDDLQI